MGPGGPGLHYYFGLSDEELADRPGLLDFLEDYRKEVSKGAEGVFPSPDDYGVEILEPLKGQKAAGTLRLIHCGKRDDRYAARVGAFDWDAFYRDYAGFMGSQMLKDRLRRAADIVLIDSRTGYTDISQVTVLQIPDVVCICFTCNRQNLAETVKMVEILHQNQAERDRRNLGRRQVLLIPSRVPVTQEPGLYEEWLDEATEAFDYLVELGAVGRDATRTSWKRPWSRWKPASLSSRTGSPSRSFGRQILPPDSPNPWTTSPSPFSTCRKVSPSGRGVNLRPPSRFPIVPSGRDRSRPQRGENSGA